MALELYAGEYGPLVDEFAAGVVIYMMFFECDPWIDLTEVEEKVDPKSKCKLRFFFLRESDDSQCLELKKMVYKGNLFDKLWTPNYSARAPAVVAQTLISLLAKNPEDRCTAIGALTQEWFDLDDDELQG